MQDPLVSILIPVYNRGSIVGRAIDSALAQTYKNIEIIISDNASTDHTWEVMQKYARLDKRVQIYRNEENVGPVCNWKECLKHASGKYAKFLWSDDEILPTFIKVMVEAMEKNPLCGFAYSCVKIKLSHNTLSNCYALFNTGYYSSELYVEGACFGKYDVPCSPGCALFYLSALKEYLIVDIPNKDNLDFSRYGAGNDQLLFLYACEQYPDMFYYNEELSVFVGGKDSITMTNSLEHYYTTAIFYFLRCTKKFSSIRKRYFKEKLYSEDYYMVPHYRMKQLYYEIKKKLKGLLY